jgi:hypothetical protein
VIASKAHAETTNIAKRMGKMEELEKGMALLEKMRSVIGDDLYAKQVRCLFAALPNFKAFDSAVNIIDVDSTVNHTTGTDDEWRTLKRRLSSDDERYTTTNKKKTRSTAACTADVQHNDDGNFDDDCLLEDDHEDGTEEKSDSEE